MTSGVVGEGGEGRAVGLLPGADEESIGLETEHGAVRIVAAPESQWWKNADVVSQLFSG
jgi:hypothetical protein